MLDESEALSQPVQSDSSFVAVSVTVFLSALTLTFTEPPASIFPPFASMILTMRPVSAAGTVKGLPTVSAYSY